MSVDPLIETEVSSKGVPPLSRARKPAAAPPVIKDDYDEPFRFVEGVIFGALISSAAWAAVVLWIIV